MPRSRVDRHPGGLIQDDKVRILVDDVQGAGGGDDAAAPLGVGQADGQHLSCLWTKPGVDPPAIHQNAVLQPLDPPHHRPGQAQVPLEQGVHLDSRQLRRDGQLQPPAHSFLFQRWM